MKSPVFVTLFDQNYLPQALSMYRSLLRHQLSFELWMVCADSATENFLEWLSFPSVHILNLESQLTPELRRAQSGRKNYEFLWTLTPFLFDFVFNQDSDIETVTYLDADLWFISSPHLVLQDFSGSSRSVLLTEHGFSKSHESAIAFGRFNVQFLSMKRDGSSNARNWWQQRVLEWCHARLEDGKYGDQGYLNELERIYRKETYVVPEIGHFLGPWNIADQELKNPVAYHFHSFQVLRMGLVKPYRHTWDVPRWFHTKILPKYLSDISWSRKLIRTYNSISETSNLPLSNKNVKISRSERPGVAEVGILRYIWFWLRYCIRMCSENRNVFLSKAILAEMIQAHLSWHNISSNLLPKFPTLSSK